MGRPRASSRALSSKDNDKGKSEMRDSSPFDFAQGQNDGVKRTQQEQGQQQEQKQQHRPGKIGGREAAFPAMQLAKARAQPQRASALVGDPVRSGRNDDSCVGVRKNKQEQEQEQRRNTGISPLRRQSAPPSVEMTLVWWVERTGNDKSKNNDKSRSLRDDKQKDRQQQRQQQW